MGLAPLEYFTDAYHLENPIVNDMGTPDDEDDDIEIHPDGCYTAHPEAGGYYINDYLDISPNNS